MKIADKWNVRCAYIPCGFLLLSFWAYLVSDVHSIWREAIVASSVHCRLQREKEKIFIWLRRRRAGGSRMNTITYAIAWNRSNSMSHVWIWKFSCISMGPERIEMGRRKKKRNVNLVDAWRMAWCMMTVECHFTWEMNFTHCTLENSLFLKGSLAYSFNLKFIFALVFVSWSIAIHIRYSFVKFAVQIKKQKQLKKNRKNRKRRN